MYTVLKKELNLHWLTITQCIFSRGKLPRKAELQEVLVADQCMYEAQGTTVSFREPIQMAVLL